MLADEFKCHGSTPEFRTAAAFFEELDDIRERRVVLEEPGNIRVYRARAQDLPSKKALVPALAALKIAALRGRPSAQTSTDSSALKKEAWRQLRALAAELEQCSSLLRWSAGFFRRLIHIHDAADGRPSTQQLAGAFSRLYIVRREGSQLRLDYTAIAARLAGEELERRMDVEGHRGGVQQARNRLALWDSSGQYVRISDLYVRHLRSEHPALVKIISPNLPKVGQRVRETWLVDRLGLSAKEWRTAYIKERGDHRQKYPGDRVEDDPRNGLLTGDELEALTIALEADSKRTK